jgi:DNA-binding PadR family transcriptional regulator
VLKEAGLVSDRAEGNRRVYQIDPTGVSELRAYLEHFWDQSLASFKQAAQRKYEETK